MPKGVYNRKSRPVEPRFWPRVNITDYCWEWLGTKTSDGYGCLKIDKKQVQAHRVSFILVNGAIPENKELDHLCKNKSCVNPAHLEPVTHRVNIQRNYECPGVYYDNNKERWIAKIQIGSFKSKEEAAEAYSSAVKKIGA